MDKNVRVFTDDHKAVMKAFHPFADTESPATMEEIFPEEATTGSAIPMPELPAVPPMAEEVKVTLVPKDAIDQIKALIAVEDIDKAIKKQGEEIIASLEELIKQTDNAQTFLDKNKKVAETPPTEEKA